MDTIGKNKILAVCRSKILIVDDNPINLKMARNILMGNYDVFTVPNGEKMFRFLEDIHIRPDLILLDILMPEMGGYEVIKKMKAIPGIKDIPVIFLTAKSDAASELEGLSLGAVDYIIKPFSPPLLLKRIELHMLVESQRKALQHFNANLKHMVNKRTEEVLNLQNAILSTVSNLVECRDDVTGEHVLRTARTLRLLTGEMLRLGVYREELQSWDIELLVQSSQLHDVGKISIRDSILLKPGKLDEKEFNEMKKHAMFGEAIIDTMQHTTKENAFLIHARIMAGAHHEKWDGSGYPRGLAGENIPLQGRLMAIADVYDALVSERPYKKAFPREQAVRIIMESFGSQFDPALAEAFTAVAVRFSEEETRALRH
ncbi:MAG: response regulator [Candidatus Accumulibacter sp.]|jgi:putative two-component system response regulator|nr:response regulator [Accumulibacter sp.]